jgi:hypothetical protein
LYLLAFVADLAAFKSPASMLSNVKTRAATTKRVATDAIVAAGSAMKQGLSTSKDKRYEAAMKMPLVADETEAEVISPVEEKEEKTSEARKVKEKLVKVGAAFKVSAKHKYHLAASGAAEKIGTTFSMKGVKGKYDAGVGALIDTFSSLKTRSVPLLSLLEAECIDLLVSMGFARRDAVNAVQVFGAEDLPLIVDFLCQEPGSRASAPDWNEHIAVCIARRMVELELDEEENMQIVLALSRFQAEVSAATGSSLPEASPFAPFHCWQGVASSDSQLEHVTGMVFTQKQPEPFYLRPSVGTWMQPLPRAMKPQCVPAEDLIDLSPVQLEKPTSVESTSDLPEPDAHVEQKAADGSGLVSSRHGAVCCGA